MAPNPTKVTRCFWNVLIYKPFWKVGAHLLTVDLSSEADLKLRDDQVGGGDAAVDPLADLGALLIDVLRLEAAFAVEVPLQSEDVAALPVAQGDIPVRTDASSPSIYSLRRYTGPAFISNPALHLSLLYVSPALKVP